ncbi:MAG: DUF4430 domain-containing protein [Ruminiclostridium sp.]
MKNKLWLAALLIISILTIVFFWEGNHQVSTTGTEESSIETKALNSAASSGLAEEQQNNEYNGQADTKIGKADQSTSEIGKKESKKVLPDKTAELEKSAAAIQKKQEQVTLQQRAPAQKAKDNEALKSTESNLQSQEVTALEDKKDKYLTDPIPQGKPKPVEWQAATIDKNKELTCTLSVTCKTILNNIDKFNKDKLEVLPEDGIIYKTKTVTFNEGESVFDVLLREMKKNRIHMEFEMTPIYNSNYIEGIHNLYEFDCGELSGWMYKVNGWFPNYGCSRYMLKAGDIVDWIYTCDLGRDIGGGMAVGGKK